MKVMLNGATRGTNFGDFLFAKMFQEHIAQRIGKENVIWHQSRYAYSDFYRKHLKNENQVKLKETDALIYISGGYFCGNDDSLKKYLQRFLSYYWIGLQCIMLHKPYAIIGVEVGNSKNKIINLIQKVILLHAKTITVRNRASGDALNRMGIYHAKCTADSAFCMSEDLLSGILVPSELQKCKSKRILLHVNPVRKKNEIIIEKIIPAVNRFIERHPEYCVVLTCDQYSKEEKIVLNDISEFVTAECISIVYNNPLELCRVIQNVDVIITTKLHVGIVGAKYRKSVISFSGHTEKIQRFYQQIGESDRTYPLDQLTEEICENMIEKYYDKEITIKDDIITDSLENFKILDDFLDKYVV